MHAATQDFWQDDRGFVISTELTLLSTIVMISLVAGMAGLSGTMTEELSAMAAPANPSLPVDRYSSLNLALPQADLPAETLPANRTTSESAAG